MPKKVKKDVDLDAENPEWEQVTLELSADVIAAVRETGPGWQVRVNDALLKAFVK